MIACCTTGNTGVTSLPGPGEGTEQCRRLQKGSTISDAHTNHMLTYTGAAAMIILRAKKESPCLPRMSHVLPSLRHPNATYAIDAAMIAAAARWHQRTPARE